jgi:hypothetical protein
VSWIDAYDYWTQAAIYREGVWIQYGVEVDCFIAAMEKVEPADRAVFHLDDTDHLEACVWSALRDLEKMEKLWTDRVPANRCERCEQCDYCIETKVLTKPITRKPELMRF